MTNVDFILIAQSEIFDYEEFSNLPIDRVEIFRELVYPRMIYYKGSFHSHLDIINKIKDGVFYSEANYIQRRKLLNIWNLPGSNGIHLSSYLLDHDISTKVINNFNSEWDIFCEIYDSCYEKPIIGISTTFYLSYNPIRKIIIKLRNKYPDIVIVLGGSFINEQFISHGIEYFEKAMRKNEINYIIHSFNSENDLKDLLHAKKNNTGIEGVNNLCYFEADINDSKFNFTSQLWNLPVLGSINSISDLSEYHYINHTIQIRTSSGCPYSCSFCSYPKIAGKFMAMSPESIDIKLNAISKNPNINKIIFIDDTINSNRGNFREMCRVLMKYHFEWFAFLRVNTLDEDTVKMMKDSGCRGLFLGLESANENILKIMNKKASINQYTRGINLLKKYDILTMGAFIIGFPGDTEDTINQNIDFINNSGLDFYKFEEFFYLHHTPIYDKRELYKLTGEGNNWQHKTMDYKTASTLKINMFREIQQCIYIDSDTSLWSIAYMYDQGYPITTIKNIQKEINKIVLSQIDGFYDDMHPSYNIIKELITNSI